MPGPLIVLGPQRPLPNLAAALHDAQVEGPVALITAGWRADEAHIGPITEHLDREVLHLPLYDWFDQLEDSELAARYRERSSRIIGYKRAYGLRLQHALEAHRAVQALSRREPDVHEDEVEEALCHLRALDDRCVARLDEIRADFPELEHPWTWPEASGFHRQAIDVLDRAGAVLIAGGHVGVLRNRLEFFGFLPLLRRVLWKDKALVSWSAGAMALSDRIVLFYDDPPDGKPGQAEILDRGLGLLPDAVFFPHARRRLRLEDTERIAQVAERFAPSQCLALECGAWLVHEGDAWSSRGVRDCAHLLKTDGTLGVLP